MNEIRDGIEMIQFQELLQMQKFRHLPNIEIRKTNKQADMEDGQTDTQLK